MKKHLLSLCLLLACFSTAANAQFFKSETTRKAGEKLEQGDRAGALAVLDKAIEKRKDLLEAYQMRASLRLMAGDLDGAISDHTAALAISPNDARIYERRAAVRSFRRDHAGALEDLNAAITYGLKTEKVYTSRARIKNDTGDTEGAIADYQAALAINPNLASAANGLAFLLEHKKGDLEGAIFHLQGFLARFEDERGGKLPRLEGGTPTASSVLIRPDEKEKAGGRAAVVVTEAAVASRPKSAEEMDKRQAEIEQLRNLAIAYANLGRMYASKNDFDKALENYEKGLRISQDDAYIHRLRSEIRIKQGDLQGAIEDLTVAVNNPAGPPDRHLHKGLLLTLQGKDDEAEKEFALHLQMFPTSRNFLNKQVEEAKKLRSRQSQP